MNRIGQRRRVALKRLFGLAAASVAAAITLAACAGSSGGDPTEGSPEPVKLTTSYLPVAAFAPYTVAEKEGIWAAHGIDLELVKFNTSADSLAALVAGQIDLAQVNVGAIGAAIVQGLPIKILAAGYWDEDTQGIYVANDSPIHDLADLKDKSLGVGGLGNNFQAVVNAALDEAGVDPASVNFTLIPIGDTAKTLLAGQLDAAQLAEPSLTAETGKMRPILEHPWDVLGAGEPHLISYIITSEATFDQKKDELKTWVDAWNESLEFTQNNPDAARSAVASETGISTDITDVMRLATWRTDLDFEGAQRQLELMVQFGMLETAPNLKDAVGAF